MIWVFGDIGPIDSIIQVAGSINRNNNPDKEHSPLYVVNFGDSNKIYGTITSVQASSALSTKKEFNEEDYFELVDSYFNNISSRQSFRFNEIFNSMKALRYDSADPMNDMPVSSFKIIEESNSTKAVFVELDDIASQLKMNYLRKIKGEISKEEFDEKYKSAFHQHIITVPNYYTSELDQINEYESNLLVIKKNL